MKFTEVVKGDGNLCSLVIKKSICFIIKLQNMGMGSNLVLGIFMIGVKNFLVIFSFLDKFLAIFSSHCIRNHDGGTTHHPHLC